jgi:hypothetical protein
MPRVLFLAMGIPLAVLALDAPNPVAFVVALALLALWAWRAWIGDP